MGFTVEQACPQCGAPVDIDETDLLFECPFCRVRSYFSASDYFRFVLPNNTNDKQIIHIPYLRFKGTIYYCIGDHVTNKEIDISAVGSSLEGLPGSLGIKPQTVKSRFVTPATKGSFLPVDVKMNETIDDRIAKLPKATKGNSSGFSPGRKVHHHENQEWVKLGVGMITGIGIGNPLRGFRKDLKADMEELKQRSYKNPAEDTMYYEVAIGETANLVYLPTYIEGDVLFDAVTNSRIARLSGNDLIQRSVSDPEWKLNFLPVLCPECGWDLQGSRNSVVLTCGNCDTAWESAGNKFTQIEALTIPGKNPNTTHLPFWRICIESDNFAIHSYADFAQINMILASEEKELQGDMHFLVPAFKTAPKPFLNIGKRFTSLQHLYPSYKKGYHIEHPYPVTLPRSEAIESIKIILAESCSAFGRKRLFSNLQEGSIDVKGCGIIYLPFTDMGYELAPQYVSSQGIPKDSLHYDVTFTEAPNAAEEAPTPASCPLCGEQVPGSSSHCPYCGIKL